MHNVHAHRDRLGKEQPAEFSTLLDEQMLEPIDLRPTQYTY